MNSQRFLPILVLLVACGAPAARPATAPGPMGFSMPSNTPERIIAPGVPIIEGLPHGVKTGLSVQIAGMVPVDSAGGLVAGSDLSGQSRQVMRNLVAVVRAAKGVPGDVVSLTVYLRDPSPAAVQTVKSAILDAVGRDAPPAVTIVGVTALPEAQMMVMISGVAQLRSEFPDRTRMR